MYGTQADDKPDNSCPMFENDVKMYGTQACRSCREAGPAFENDVKMYGTQALLLVELHACSLRMM